jgi:hypothetical protein
MYQSGLDVLGVKSKCFLDYSTNQNLPSFGNPVAQPKDKISSVEGLYHQNRNTRSIILHRNYESLQQLPTALLFFFSMN